MILKAAVNLPQETAERFPKDSCCANGHKGRSISSANKPLTEVPNITILF